MGEFRVSSFEFRGTALGRIVVLLVPMLVIAADGMDPRGEPSVLRGIFGIGLLIFGPLVGGIVLGLVQLALYRGLAAAGVIQRDHIPIFPVFLLRGLILTCALVAGGLFYLKASGKAVPWEEAQSQGAPPP